MSNLKMFVKEAELKREKTRPVIEIVNNEFRAKIAAADFF